MAELCPMITLLVLLMWNKDNYYIFNVLSLRGDVEMASMDKKGFLRTIQIRLKNNENKRCPLANL